MPLLTLNLSCENVKYPAQKHFEKTNICSNANGSLAFLRRNLKIAQTHIKANTYTTLVRPQLEYAAAVWDPYTEQNQDKLEMVQRRAARYVFNDYSRYSHVTPMLQQLGWRSLMQRRGRHTSCLFLQVSTRPGCY